MTSNKVKFNSQGLRLINLDISDANTILTLINLHEYYENEDNPKVPYWFFPNSSNNYYNSNSYISGLLYSAGLNMEVSYISAMISMYYAYTGVNLDDLSGWTKPLPGYYFGIGGTEQ